MLPPIDSLELIPEPDGSPTVKVEIPEGFKEREKKLMQPYKMPATKSGWSAAG